MTGPTFTTLVDCVAAIWIDYGATTAAVQIYLPYWPYPTGTTLGSFLNPVDIILNGSITIHNGTGGVDAQAIHTRYNNLTMLWSEDNSYDLDTDPYIILRGQTLQYTVLDPWGNPADGTTWGGPGHWAGTDGMDIERLAVEMDMDGAANLGWLGSRYRLNGGWDWEDGQFVFSGANAIVSVNDKNGGNGVDLIGVSAAGNPIYALSLYERDNGELDKCDDPRNETPCLIIVEVDLDSRVLNVLDISNCMDLDATDIPDLTGIAF
jgi:hypothetical protein